MTLLKHTQTHWSKQMTPYELRFEIYKQAYAQLSDTYHAAFSSACEKNDGKLPEDFSHPYPCLGEILEVADIINSFVSSK